MSTVPPLLLVDVTLVVDKVNLDAFLKGLYISYSGVIAEKECTLFEVSISEPDAETDEVTVRLNEAWTCTEEWFKEVQLKKPYYGPYLEATQKFWKRERIIKYYKRLPEWSYHDDAHVVVNKPI